jgi:hypothetical protein
MPEPVPVMPEPMPEEASLSDVEIWPSLFKSLESVNPEFIIEEPLALLSFSDVET